MFWIRSRFRLTLFGIQRHLFSPSFLFLSSLFHITLSPCVSLLPFLSLLSSSPSLIHPLSLSLSLSLSPCLSPLLSPSPPSPPLFPPLSPPLSPFLTLSLSFFLSLSPSLSVSLSHLH